MAVITSLYIVEGTSAHVGFEVLNQAGAVMPGPFTFTAPTLSDPAQDTLVPDANTAGTTVTSTGGGPNTMTVGVEGLTITGSLPIVNEAGVATSVQFTSP